MLPHGVINAEIPRRQEVSISCVSHMASVERKPITAVWERSRNELQSRGLGSLSRRRIRHWSSIVIVFLS